MHIGSGVRFVKMPVRTGYRSAALEFPSRPMVKRRRVYGIINGTNTPLWHDPDASFYYWSPP